MRTLNYPILFEFIDAEIEAFYDSQERVLKSVRLRDVLRKNIFLFRAKNLNTPALLITALLDARLSSSEEKRFGDLLENIALHVSAMTCDGRKSSARGIDLEFDDAGIRYLVAIKSGGNWGNSSQYQSLETNFRTALQVQRQSRHHLPLQAVLGICYGKEPERDTGLYVRRSGQRFWAFLSNDDQLYQRILEQVGKSADGRNRSFAVERTLLEQELIDALQTQYILPDGQIDWLKILETNSGTG